MAALPRPLDGPARRVVHGQHVHPVHRLRRHVVAAGVLHHVRHRGDALECRAHAVAVVLAQEDHRQLPHRRHVQGLVEGADVHRGLAEKTDADLVAALILGRERDPGRERNVGAHNAVAAHEAPARVEEVHRPALALGAARRLPEQLRHYDAGRNAPHQRLAVFAVGRDGVVVVTQRAEATDRHRFLPDVENPPILPSAYASAVFSSKRRMSSMRRSIVMCSSEVAVTLLPPRPAPTRDSSSGPADPTRRADTPAPSRTVSARRTRRACTSVRSVGVGRRDADTGPT